jgi:3-deoxy-7-phosphoheptulonate synthase
MIVVLKPEHQEDDITRIVEYVEGLGGRVHISKGEHRTIVGLIGDGAVMDAIENIPIASFPGVESVLPILKPYKLVSREFKPESTIISIGDIRVGGAEPVIILGCCVVESEELWLDVISFARSTGSRVLLAKPWVLRKSPYSFSGWGEKALPWLRASKERHDDLKLIIGVHDSRQVEMTWKDGLADAYLTDPRTINHTYLLEYLGELDLPVLLARNARYSFGDWLDAAERILANGNEKVILCECGSGDFEEEESFSFNLHRLATLRTLTHLPIIVNINHAIGNREVLLGEIFRNAFRELDGFIIEVHPDPTSALVGSKHVLGPAEVTDFVKHLA